MKKVDFSAADLVSFDIFDTALHRKVLAPVDVFDMVRLKAFELPEAVFYHQAFDNFTYSRINAERDARKEHPNGEITLDEIYANLCEKIGLPQKIIDRLKGFELQIERAVLYPSDSSISFYNKACRLGLKVAFISDMYLPSEWLAETLEMNGYVDAKKTIVLVSGEKRANKHSGELYEVAAKQIGVKDRSRWIHVGDNRHADIAMATKAGIKAVHADWSKVDNTYHPNNGSLVAPVVKSLTDALDLPQAVVGQPQKGLERIGYRLFGPLLFGFTIWLLREAKNRKFDHMMFVARDGHLPKYLFEMLAPKVSLADLSTEYFYISRKVGYQYGMREWDTEHNWFLSAGKTPKAVKKTLETANISVDDARTIMASEGIHDTTRAYAGEDVHRVKMAIDKSFNMALRTAKANRDKLKAYFTKPLEGRNNVAFVDIGWAGNIQRAYLQAINDPVAIQNLNGLFLGTLDSSHRNVEKGLKISGWMCDGGAPRHVQDALTSGGVELLEFALTADHGSTIGLEGTGDNIKPILEEMSECDIEYWKMAEPVQNGIKNFVKDYAWLLDIYTPDSLCSTVWADPFLRLVTKPTQEEVDALAAIKHSDTPGTHETRLQLATRQSWLVRKRKKCQRYHQAREKAFWKAGFDKLNK